MENIKDTVAKNLVKLRKENKLTQVELAEKLNYSDKAVSRWESGEVSPDIETLNKIAGVYGVDIASLFDQDLNVQDIEKLNKREAGNRKAIVLLAISFVWFLVTILYVYVNLIFQKSLWIVFVYGVPATILIALIFNCIWGERLWRFIFISALVWALLACFYIAFITYNIWLIFLLGAPIQIAIVLWSSIKPRKCG